MISATTVDLFQHLTSNTTVDLWYKSWPLSQQLIADNTPVHLFRPLLQRTVHLCISSSPLFDIVPLTSATWLTTATKIDLCNKRWPLPKKIDLCSKSWPLLQKLTFATTANLCYNSWPQYTFLLTMLETSDWPCHF